MYGLTLDVKHGELKIRLRKPEKEDLPELVKFFSSASIHLFTNGLFAQTIENELEWYEKNRKDPDTCLWLIQPEGSEVPIGVTGLHGLSNMGGTCTSGIIIWDKNWWKKGIATAAHEARNWFACNWLNRFTIRSCVRVENVASFRALQTAGYSVWGEEPVDDFRDGRWLATYHMIYFRPSTIHYMFPDGIPEKYLPGHERAIRQMALAEKEVFRP